VIKEPLRT